MVKGLEFFAGGEVPDFDAAVAGGGCEEFAAGGVGEALDLGVEEGEVVVGVGFGLPGVYVSWRESLVIGVAYERDERTYSSLPPLGFLRCF